MDKFPVCWNGSVQGELTLNKENLYTRFHVRCCLPGGGLWCVWAVGEKGELRLGVLEPCGDRAEICRRFSEQMTQPVGALLRGELRPVIKREESRWKGVSEMAHQTPWLQQLRNCAGVMVCMDKRRYSLAVPYAQDRPFPLLSLFCFADIQCISGKRYAVFAFDERNQPVFPEKNRHGMEKTGKETEKN